MTMITENRPTFLGTNENDGIGHGYSNGIDAMLDLLADVADAVNGRKGDDLIETGAGNDLAAGDMLGEEWSLVDGVWVYDAGRQEVSDMYLTRSYDDVIVTGAGNDVLLGNGGNDMLHAGAGDDIVNAGRDNDMAWGGLGNDLLNLEHGNDYAEGGQGDDIVNGGAGDDEIYGDDRDDNLLAQADETVAGFGAHASEGGWTFSDSYGVQTIAQSASTVAGESYTVAFELAANLSAGLSSAKVEVLWNGEVVDTVQADSGVFSNFEVEVISNGSEGELAFRTVDTSADAGYDFSGPIASYAREVELGGETVSVAAFAPGQSGLYQVISGHLHLFDTETNTYTQIGDAPGFKINAIGFNVEDDLIYGVAKSNGVDSLGNAVSSTDIVMLDANGASYRVGEGHYGDYVGDFDDAGNLWTFHTALNRLSVVDVDNRDADGNPAVSHFHFPSDLFTDRTYDLAYNAAEQMFQAVIAPRVHGGDGKLVSIDVSAVAEGGLPTFTEMPITGTLYGDEMQATMAKGAYGAVFFDGDGNLFYGLNRGDHDLDASTENTGGIYRINVDWQSGEAHAEFMAEAPATGSNDGTVDPRSADAFVEVDAEAAVLLRAPTLTPVAGGNDQLRGGTGEDVIHGNGGDDTLSGGADDDALYGDEGNDVIDAGTGDDFVWGGTGNDKMRGEAGNDALAGGAGDDYAHGGSGDDAVSGDAGADKLVGGTGADVINGGAGNDKLWGGNWSGDGEADTFVFEAGTGKDFVFDFEAGVDRIDLTAWNTDMAALGNVADDQGWATILDLASLDGGQAGDRVILMNVDFDALDSDSFML
ncbi:calcium-binding protein [Pontivivens insulae]|uniref:Leukotoxin n=1 Tax=Pontivivens insulae TaxID=1639689 RepID=A0A2R8A6U5_9RHOB|nr:calcium-binding protein [Pontivivens insulae]RED18029.1 hemolysin type calcium-binding protein [Pontivivens insulae]SPF27925.1 Leukotoxin [Pontivivens insulae]